VLLRQLLCYFKVLLEALVLGRLRKQLLLQLNVHGFNSGILGLQIINFYQVTLIAHGCLASHFNVVDLGVVLHHL